MKDHIFKIYLYIVWILVNKTNFENQMNIYNLCISFILKHDYREMLGRSKAFFITFIMFYHTKGINN